MAKDKFTWTHTEPNYTRSYGGKKPALLEPGKTYDSAGYPAEVLAEWERSGHIKFTGKAGKEDSNG